MKRRIPNWIGKVPVPENRATTLLLLNHWAKLLDITLPDLTREKEDAPTYEFMQRIQELAGVLQKKMDERRMCRKCIEGIYVGRPTTIIGELNCNLASVLHLYFENFGVKGIKTKAWPLSEADIREISYNGFIPIEQGRPPLNNLTEEQKQAVRDITRAAAVIQKNDNQ